MNRAADERNGTSAEPSESVGGIISISLTTTSAVNLNALSRPRTVDNEHMSAVDV